MTTARRSIDRAAWRRVGALAVVLSAVASCAREPEPTYQGRPMSEWLQASADADAVGTAIPAFRALAAIGEPAVQPLIERLSSNETRVRVGAYAALSNFCPEVLPRLHEALSRARDTSRFYLTRAIDNIRQHAATDPASCPQ